jgi:hypothetical protein
MLSALAQAAPPAAHEHGVAQLTLVQERSTVTIALDSPLDSIVGFEHAPASTAEKAALSRAGERLRDVAAVLSLPAAAGCTVAEMDVDLPFAEGDAAAHDAHGHDHEEGGHADVSASYTLDCTDPAALDALKVRLFDTFPRMRQVRAEAATAHGQGAATLTRDSAIWTLPAR